MNIRRILLTSLFAVPITAGFLYAQPVVAPTGGDLLCSVDTSSIFQVDTVSMIDGAPVQPDSNGFWPIFDGKTWKGWWQNCRSSHSGNNRTLGAIWRIDTNRRAIYAMVRHGNYNAQGGAVSSGGTAVSENGGLIATHKRYGHYELMFDWWPEYGNDGGVFNRFTITSATSVAANQMVLDYMDASGILSYYSEAGWPGSRNGRPWTYNQSITGFTSAAQQPYGDTVLSIPGFGGNSGDLTNWTTMTSKLNPTAYGCKVTGCEAADYLRLWPRHGWVQIRQRYYGGLSTNQGVSTFTLAAGLNGNMNDKIHAHTFFRKYYPTDTSIYFPVANVSDTAQWIPVVKDSCALPAASVPTYSKIAPFAFQVHSGSRTRKVSQGGKGSWYRNIRVRELDSLGVPLYIPTAINPMGDKKVSYDLRIKSGMLTGNMTLDHMVFIRNVKGEILQRISGIAGRDVRYEMPAQAGVYVVQVRTSRGTQSFRFVNQGAAR